MLTFFIFIYYASLAIGIVHADPPRSLNDYKICSEYIWTDPTKHHFNDGEKWRSVRVYDDLVVHTDPISGDKFTNPTPVKVNLKSGTGLFSARKDAWFEVSAGISNKPGGDYWAKVRRDGSKGLGQQFMLSYLGADNNIINSTWVMPNEHCHHIAPFIANDVVKIRMPTRHL